MNHGIDALRGLGDMLRMMGIPISGSLYAYGVKHQLYKIVPNQNQYSRSNLVCYHAVNGSGAMGKSLAGHIPRTKNVVELMTKVYFMGKDESIFGSFLV